MTVEKLCRNKTPGVARFLKRTKNRLLRRLAKRDPENAPRRTRDVTRGWSD